MDAIHRVSNQQGANTADVNAERSIDNGASASARLERLQSALTSAQNRVIKLQNEQSTTISQQCFPVQPKIGRIFFFPHGCPHEKRPTVSVPKIFLRAELILRNDVGRDTHNR